VIPRANITAWRKHAPWPDNAQVEQDLVLTRALVEMFRRSIVAKQAVFRGGTALHKLYLDPPGRYSEDIDLVQKTPGPIGALVDDLREALDPWLGPPKWKQSKGRFTLIYRFETSFAPVVWSRLTVEINTREHFSVLAPAERELRVANPWFTGAVSVPTYLLPELLGSKLRALYQRKKGRDLFDLWLGLAAPDADASAVLASFNGYMDFVGASASRAQFEANMSYKMDDAGFLGDATRLLRPGLAYDPSEAWRRVHDQLISRIPGAPWKGKADPRA